MYATHKLWVHITWALFCVTCYVWMYASSNVGKNMGL